MILLNLANIVIAAHAKSEFQTTDSLRLFSCHEQTPGAVLSSIDNLLCTGLKYDALSVLKVKSAKGAIDFSPGQANVRSVALGLRQEQYGATGLVIEKPMLHAPHRYYSFRIYSILEYFI